MDNDYMVVMKAGMWRETFPFRNNYSTQTRPAIKKTETDEFLVHFVTLLGYILCVN